MAKNVRADPHITSRSLRLNGRNYAILGVAPLGFQGINSMYAADIWVPMMMYEQIYPTPAWVNQRRALLFSVAGRLKPGLGMAQAEAGCKACLKTSNGSTLPKIAAGRSSSDPSPKLPLPLRPAA